MCGCDFSGIPQWKAWTWCMGNSAAFVVSLYLVPARLRRLPRSDPRQIRARFGAVSFITVASVVATRLLARSVEDADGVPFRKWIGIGSHRLALALVLPLLLTCSLFLGPLVTTASMLYVRMTNEVSSRGRTKLRAHKVPWHLAARMELANKVNLDKGISSVIRNILVGPISEEVVFRGCFVPVLLGAGVSRTRIIFLSPFMFGFAHLHHALEWVRHGLTIRTVAAMVAFQIAYTSVFGAFAVFVHLRTGHLASSILVHIVCNFMGVPDTGFAVKPDTRLDSPTSVLYNYRRGLWCCYGVGVFLFCSLLFPFTSPRLYRSIFWSYDELSR